jgi:hypothetical protein
MIALAILRQHPFRTVDASGDDVFMATDSLPEGGKGTAQMTPCDHCFAPAMKGWRVPRSRQDGVDCAPERMACHPTEFIRAVVVA